MTALTLHRNTARRAATDHLFTLQDAYGSVLGRVYQQPHAWLLRATSDLALSLEAPSFRALCAALDLSTRGVQTW